MKIYDITQPLFECKTFPGDITPEKTPVNRIEEGSLYNLTNLSMCVHNGTLEKEVVLLEGIRLYEVSDGEVYNIAGKSR